MENMESNEIEIVNVNMFKNDQEYEKCDENNLSVITCDPFEDIGDVTAVSVENEHNSDINGLVEVYMKGENKERDAPAEQRNTRHRFTLELDVMENEMDYPDILYVEDLQSYGIKLNPNIDQQRQKSRGSSGRKKKTNHAFRSVEAQRKRLARQMETVQDRANRLASQRVRTSISRTNENSAQREERLHTERIRRASSRSRESDEVRQRRLHADRVRHAKSRKSESYESRQQRLYADRTRHAKLRAVACDNTRRRSSRDDQRIRRIVSRLIKTEKECAIDCLKQNWDCC